MRPGHVLLALNQDDAIGALVREWPQHDAVDDAEHGGVEADAERQREDGDSGEAGRAPQRARRVADASGEVIHADSRGCAEEWSAAYRRVYASDLQERIDHDQTSDTDHR